jgi:hypothetical protein
MFAAIRIRMTAQSRFDVSKKGKGILGLDSLLTRLACSILLLYELRVFSFESESGLILYLVFCNVVFYGSLTYVVCPLKAKQNNPASSNSCMQV